MKQETPATLSFANSLEPNTPSAGPSFIGFGACGEQSGSDQTFSPTRPHIEASKLSHLFATNTSNLVSDGSPASAAFPSMIAQGEETFRHLTD